MIAFTPLRYPYGVLGGVGGVVSPLLGRLYPRTVSRWIPYGVYVGVLGTVRYQEGLLYPRKVPIWARYGPKRGGLTARRASLPPPGTHMGSVWGLARQYPAPEGVMTTHPAPFKGKRGWI
jgi:hypothetical protein